MNPIEDFVTTAQAAARLEISQTRVAIFIRQGRIKAEKMGRIWLIPVTELERFAGEDRRPGWEKGRPRKAAQQPQEQ